MDILCPVCAEPYDHDELHEIASELEITYNEASKRFRTVGCALFGNKHDETPDQETAAMARQAYELLGSDLDGAASMFEDYGLT